MKYSIKLTDNFSGAKTEKLTKDITLEAYFQLEKMKDLKIPINEFNESIRWTWLIDEIRLTEEI
jgi:hypothetical protein